MDFRLCAIDLDGTTLNHAGEISAGNRHALHELAKQGVQIAVLTGKSHAAAMPIAAQLGSVTHLITCNGAYIYHVTAQQELASFALQSQPVRQVQNELEKCPVDYCAYTRDVMYAPKESRLAARIREVYPHLPVVVGPLPEHAAFHKVYVAGANVALIELYNRLKQFEVHVLPSSETDLEISHPLANKGEALRFLKSHLGLSTEQTMAVGNYDNDLPMFAEAGLAVAVDNAPDHVKAMAHFVTKHHDADGVAYAIDQVLSRNHAD